MRNSIQDIAKILTDRHGLDRSEAEKFVTLMFDTIREGVEQDGLVKVRGFGTFKIVGVEARESVNVNTGERVTIESHGKVTFTPDSTMKELVNKPFSQFETVILNEGIEFDDMDDNREEEVKEPEPVVEEITEEIAAVAENLADCSDNEELPVGEPVLVEENPIVEDVPVVEDIVIEQQEPEEQVVSEQVSVEPSPVPEESAVAEDDIAEEDDVVAEDATTGEASEEEGSSVWKWVLYCLISLVLMAVSAYGGYQYGVYSTMGNNAAEAKSGIRPKRKQVVIRKIVRPKRETAKPDSAVMVVKKDSAAVEKESERTEEFDSSKYDRMDNRVRTGAYRIVGTDKIVTVGSGETLGDISRRMLGADEMSCYIEVYNGFERDVKLKAGQKVMIPKLELKKKRRK